MTLRVNGFEFVPLPDSCAFRARGGLAYSAIGLLLLQVMTWRPQSHCAERLVA